MTRTPQLLWLALLFILLLPTAGGRFLLDLAGGVLITLITISLLIAGAGWIGWRILQSKLVKCEVCGMSSINNSSQCPFCGSNLIINNTSNNQPQDASSVPASSATIDIKVESSDSNQ